MKKNIFLLVLLLLVVIATQTQAQEWYAEEFCCNESCCRFDRTRFYAEIFSGVNFLDNTAIEGNKSKYSPGYIIACSLGYSWCYGLRLEGEYAFRRNAIEKIHFFEEGISKHGHFQTSSFMFNLFWDLALPSWMCEFFLNTRTFIGAGIGYDFQHMHSSNSRIIFNQNWHHFSWQLVAGLAYPIFCNTEITLEYKFHQGGCHFYNNSIGVGLVYEFDI